MIKKHFRDWVLFVQDMLGILDSLLSEPPGKSSNTGVGTLSLLQGIFPTKELNWGLLHCRWILYQLSYQGSPPFTLAPLKGKQLVRKLIKHVEGLFERNYKTLMRKIKEELNKWRHFSWKPVLDIIKKTKHDL